MLPSLGDWLAGRTRRYERDVLSWYLMAPCIGCAVFIFGMAYMFLVPFASPRGWVILFAGLLYSWMTWRAWKGPSRDD
jgi:hypothetical protein